MPFSGNPQLVDGRRTQQILAVEERYDTLTIVVGPRRIGLGWFLGCCVLIFLGAGLIFFLLALVFATTEQWPLQCRVGAGMVAGFWLSVIFAGFVAVVRKELNSQVVTISDGIVTITATPVFPRTQTAQLHPGDCMRVWYVEHRSWLPWPGGRREGVREYGINASGNRSKSDWNLRIIPPFTLSQKDAQTLATLMQKYATRASDESLIGTRI